MMTATAALRAVAIVFAGVAVLDPAMTVGRPVPVAVDLRIVPDSTSAGQLQDAARATAGQLRTRLTRSLDGIVAFDSSDDAAALVLVGGRPDADAIQGDIPVSTVALQAPTAPYVRIVSASEPPAVPPGWITHVAATLEAAGMAGRRSTLVLELAGAELARTGHGWTQDDERVDVKLEFAPPGPGTSALRLAVGSDGDGAVADHHVDVRLVSVERRLKILAYEPRPSWTGAFVRRALESDPVFEVSTLVRTSRGVAVRAGAPPATLSAATLAPFDAILLGAPEALTASEITALSAFARRRGGAVVFLPDRRPSGPYLELLPAGTFEEILLDEAVEVPSNAAVLKASELAIPLRLRSAVDTLATTPREGTDRAVVISAPFGAGRVVFSGALDAWRYRSDREGFGRFWRAHIGTAAAAAPPVLGVDITPGVARPGASVTVRARVRPTEFGDGQDAVVMPAIGARVTAAGSEPIRLWPLAEPGIFEGRFEAPGHGEHRVEVTTESGDVAAETILISRQDAARPVMRDTEGLALVASATGGVATSADDLAPLERHLRALPRRESAHVLHPARTVWWLLAFVGLLGGEWAIRRRSGKV